MQTEALLEFFTEHGRDLPWRGAGASPWRVLVSEVMLQQTPVNRVRPVFEEWLERWPTPAALASEPAGEAIRLWGRLGYPRRALRLWETAAIVCTRHAGAVPDDFEALLALPGIGQYTARAVLAFGFGRRVPVVDTNVRRVLHRCLLGSDDAGPATATDVELCRSALPAGEAVAARFSAAVMELGALVCTAAGPSCDRCPLRSDCSWLRLDRPPSPVKRRTQAWNGTDRQLRGRILALLREATEPLDRDELRIADAGGDQWLRCLEWLVNDGLVEVRPDGRLMLPMGRIAD